MHLCSKLYVIVPQLARTAVVRKTTTISSCTPKFRTWSTASDHHLLSSSASSSATCNNVRRFSKFTVRDPHTVPAGMSTAPLTAEKAYELLISLNESERSAVKEAMDKYEATKIKEGFEGKLAATRWRSRFGRPAKMPALGDVDPTGSYCAVPDDWLKKKTAELAKPPSSKDCWKIFLVNAVPFVGFGFLDNFTMIVAGDYIEHIFGMWMCISTMAAAGLGNTISDVLGIGSAHYVERLAEMLGLRPPDLTPVQLEMKVCRKYANMGRILGITIGCLVGMFPLMFMDTMGSKKKKDKEDDDTEKTAHISEDDLQVVEAIK